MKVLWSITTEHSQLEKVNWEKIAINMLKHWETSVLYIMIREIHRKPDRAAMKHWRLNRTYTERNTFNVFQ